MKSSALAVAAVAGAAILRPLARRCRAVAVVAELRARTGFIALPISAAPKPIRSARLELLARQVRVLARGREVRAATALSVRAAIFRPAMVAAAEAVHPLLITQELVAVLAWLALEGMVHH